MRDYTNLSWPEGPFGADQRPYGKPARILTAVAIEWTEQPAALPACATTVYLRTNPARTLDVNADTLSIGFRTTVTEHAGEVHELLDLFDRALVRARRHAVILAGHDLDRDLDRIQRLIRRQLPGIQGVSLAWADRTTRERGLATMLDTRKDILSPLLVDFNLEPQPIIMQETATPPFIIASAALGRCLSIGLAAAMQSGRYRWEGTFRVHDAVRQTAWDLLEDTNTPQPANSPS